MTTHSKRKFLPALILLIAGSFGIELWLSRPDVAALAVGFIPRTVILQDPAMLYIAIGILGATVMPHNLYLHSALVQSRDVSQTPEGIRQACKYNFIDSAVALNCGSE